VLRSQEVKSVNYKQIGSKVNQLKQGIVLGPKRFQTGLLPLCLRLILVREIRLLSGDCRFDETERSNMHRTRADKINNLHILREYYIAATLRDKTASGCRGTFAYSL